MNWWDIASLLLMLFVFHFWTFTGHILHLEIFIKKLGYTPPLAPLIQNIFFDICDQHDLIDISLLQEHLALHPFPSHHQHEQQWRIAVLLNPDVNELLLAPTLHNPYCRTFYITLNHIGSLLHQNERDILFVGESEGNLKVGGDVHCTTPFIPTLCGHSLIINSIHP